MEVIKTLSSLFPILLFSMLLKLLKYIFASFWWKFHVMICYRAPQLCFQGHHIGSTLSLCWEYLHH